MDSLDNTNGFSDNKNFVGYHKVVDRILYTLTFPLIFRLILFLNIRSTLAIISAPMEFVLLC